MPWDSATLEGVAVWYMKAGHGDMADHRPTFEALLDLLSKGHTAREALSDSAPVDRGFDRLFDLPDEEDPDLYPDGEDLEASVLGSDPERTETTAEETLEVLVAHGDIAFSADPVLVSHYQGDTLAGAEAFLDEVLDRRLSMRRELDLYPGPADTSEVVINPDRQAKPAGAVVIGLGPVGGLTPGQLAATVSKAVLRYAVMRAEERGEDEDGGTASLGLASLLIGTGTGGFLSTEDSMSAILEGVLRANGALRRTRVRRAYTFGIIRFIELYHDQAIQACRALRRLANNARFVHRIRAKAELVDLPGGRRRVSYEEAAGWWGRLQILSEKEGVRDGSLHFTSLTERARAEVSLLPTQRILVDRFVADALGRADFDTELASTLFELLLPNALKKYAPDQRHLVLMLDEGSAHYPWELLHDRSLDVADGQARPLAVRAGLIRQLVTPIYREQVVGALDAAALVVGDPQSDFPKLQAASREARLVADRLARCKTEKISVTPLIGSDFRSIVKALYARPYRIMHLAGHGVFNLEMADGKPVDESPGQEPGGRATTKVTGMVLGDGVFLTPVEFRQLRVVPDLVFLNCCFLGYIGDGGDADAKSEDEAKRDEIRRRDRHRLAANVSTGA